MNFTKKNIPFIVVADVGGSHITCGVYGVEEAKLISESIIRIDIDSSGAAEEILKSFVSALSSSAKLANVDLAALAIAMPGPFDYDLGISYIKGLKKYDALYGYDLKEYFAKHFNIDPSFVRFRNDAESVIAGEAAALTMTTEVNILGITLGTGFGSAVSNLSVTQNVDFGSEPFLGKIADEYFSTRWFTYTYWKVTGINVDGVKGLLAENNRCLVKDIFIEFSKNLIAFLQPKIKTYNVSSLIICGNIAKAHNFFLPYLIKKMPDIDIKIGELGENAAMIGAAAYFCLQPIAESRNQIQNI